MIARKVASASRALQVYLEHSLASSAGVLNKLSPAASDSWNSLVAKAVQVWIDFLQKAQTSWSPYILAAIDRIEGHVWWMMKAQGSRNRSGNSLYKTLSEISRREASYLVNAHLQRRTGDQELADMWEKAAGVCQTICLSHERGGLAVKGCNVPEGEDKLSSYRYFRTECTLKEAQENDGCAREAADAAVQVAWKLVARNCRIVRVCRRINELHGAFPHSFPFSLATTTARLARTCCKAICAVTCHAKSADYLKRAAEEEEPCVKKLFLQASELMCQLAENPLEYSAKRWDSHPMVVNVSKVVLGRATELSGLFKTLRGYEMQSKSTSLALRAARQEQLAAARRELEAVVHTVEAFEVFAGLTEKELVYENDHPVEVLLAAATSTLACSEELTADEKRVRYFTQQADAVNVSISPAHPRRSTRAGSYCRRGGQLGF